MIRHWSGLVVELLVDYVYDYPRKQILICSNYIVNAFAFEKLVIKETDLWDVWPIACHQLVMTCLSKFARDNEGCKSETYVKSFVSFIM